MIRVFRAGVQIAIGSEPGRDPVKEAARIKAWLEQLPGVRVLVQQIEPDPETPPESSQMVIR